MPAHLTTNDRQKTTRKSNRLRAKGIVVLASFDKPVVTNIYDIASGGVSFLYASEIARVTGEFKMDILIFDNQTNFEYFFTQIKGQVTSSALVCDPKSGRLVVICIFRLIIVARVIFIANF